MRNALNVKCSKYSLRIALGLVAAVVVALGASTSVAQNKDSDSKKDEASSKSDDLDDEGLYSCRKARGRFKVNLKDEVELKDLITWAMSFRCENFIYGSGIGGRSAKVVMITPKEMSAGQAWKVWQVALQNMNLTWVKKGNIIEIVEAPQAKRQALPIFSAGVPASDRVVRALIRPEHLPVSELSSILNELKSKDGDVKTLKNAGLIVVTDFGTHVARMRELLVQVDKPVVGERLYMIKVQNADANELATKISEIVGTKESSKGGGNASTPPKKNRRKGRNNKKGAKRNTSMSTEAVEVAVPSKLIADERTNSIIVLGSKPAYIRVRSLVKRLDVSVDVEGGGRIHVLVLQHADSEELAQTLSTVISGMQQNRGGNNRGANNRQGRPNQNRRQDQARPAPGSGAEAFEGLVRVTHDKPTNSLVVVASVKDFLSLRDVVRRLDTPRRQVYIEAHIVEFNVDNGRDVGVSFHGGKDFEVNGETSLAFGGVQHAELSTLGLAVSPEGALGGLQGLFGGILGPLLPGADQFFGISIPSFGVLFSALATTSNLNILSSPHILTTDNEEAEISVGTNIPYTAGVSGVPGGGGLSSFQSIQRADVALTLKITPQINASGDIRLELDLEISDIASENFNGNGPAWSKRTQKGVVIAQNQQTVVIGGLMQDRTSTVEKKVPLLGDIPLLGYLFKYTSKSKSKTNLLVTLTPYVIEDHEDLARIRIRRQQEQREFATTFAGNAEIPEDGPVDYRRKRGLLSEIATTVTKIEREEVLRKELEERIIDQPDGPIEVFEGEEPPAELRDDDDAPDDPGPQDTTSGDTAPATEE
jgi:general secretion pathway protein D